MKKFRIKSADFIHLDRSFVLLQPSKFQNNILQKIITHFLISSNILYYLEECMSSVGANTLFSALRTATFSQGVSSLSRSTPLPSSH